MIQTQLTETTLQKLGPEENLHIPLKVPFWYFLPKPYLCRHQNGFRIVKGSEQKCFLYEEIETFQWKETDRYTNGICTGTDHEIVVDSYPGIKHFSPYDSSDEFQAFAEDIVGKMADSAEIGFQKGETLKGKGWTLSSKGLALETGEIPWSQILDVDTIQKCVTIWKVGENYPVFRVREDTPQARVLLELVDRYAHENPRESSGSLGRFLFRRHANRSAMMFLAGISILLIAFGGWFLAMLSESVLMACLFLFLGGAIGFAGVFLMRRTFDFYENGILQRPGHRVLFLKDCESLQYQVTTQLINGIYAFTRIQMRLRGVENSESMRITSQCHGNDKELEQAKLEIAKKISERLYLKVCTVSEIAWGKSVRISRDGIWIFSNQRFGTSARVKIPFSNSLSYSIEHGKFYLFRAGELIPLLMMDCDEENFYPGFLLLLRLIAQNADL